MNDFVSIILIAISLCFDTFAISVSCGISNCSICKRQIIKLAVVFGLVQGSMILAGWFLGSGFNASADKAGHWIAFTLLLILGVHMFIHGFKSKEDKEKINISSFKIVLGMAIATSIDAIVIGAGFAFTATLIMRVVYAAIIVAAVTVLSAVIGIYIGKKAGKFTFISAKSEMLGGVILVAIGIKTLAEHYLA